MPVHEPTLHAIAVFILAAFFAFWEASRAAYVLLALFSVGLVLWYRPRLPREQRLYSWPIVGYFGAMLVSLAFNGFPDKGVNLIGSRFGLLLIAIPLVSVFYVSYDPKRNFWIKYVAGCVTVGGLALLDVFAYGAPRASGGGHNEAAFGFISLAMTAVVITSYHRFRPVRYGSAIFAVATLMGLAATVLSGTRGSWLAGFVVLVIAIFFYLERYPLTNRILITLTLVASIGFASFSLPNVQMRVDHMVEIVAPHLGGEQPEELNSLSERIELWKLGWKLGLENKVFGYGLGNTKYEIREYVRQHPGQKLVGDENHLHNQFMQTFAMGGLIGLVALLAMLSCHFWIFAKFLRRDYHPEVRRLALSGLLLLVSYLVFSIPAVPFYGKQYLMLYGFSSAMIWGCLMGALREAGQVDGR